MEDIKEKLFQQLATDYCCLVSEIKDSKNYFTEYKQQKDRRWFSGVDNCILKVIVVNGKLVFTGKKRMIDICRKKFLNKSGNWFMDAENFRELDNILLEEGYQIKTVHLFFIPKDAHVYEMSVLWDEKISSERNFSI